ncbi:MAG: NADH-quinone oxidoreductase subunit L [Candidatus Eisenbacteria bacterium]|nr:NADH-quinone oxidoreductase subunit L [Candidatus Eisenbacteria bacterium]
MPQLLVPIVVPAVAGGLCLLIPRRVRGVREAVSLIALAWTLVAAFRLFGQWPLSYVKDWGTLGDLTIQFDLMLTQFSAFIVVFVALFGFGVGLYSISWLSREHDGRRFYAFMLWTVAASIGAALANSLVILLLFWEALTAILYVYVNTGLKKLDASEGAAKSFVMLGLSDAALFIGVAMIWARFGTVSMDELSIFVGDGMTTWIYILLMVGAITKAGAMPFHTWIPAAAKGAPTPVMALLPAAIDKLLGIYLLARISLDLFSVGQGIMLLLMIIGAVTIIGAVLMALVQHDLKVLLSYHAVSQVGYMILGIGTGIPIAIAGGLFHMLNNAIYKSGLFLSAGSLEKQAGTTEIKNLGGLARAMPVTFIATAVFALSISGVPPLNGFVSKWMVYSGLVELGSRGVASYWIFLVAAFFGSALTLASFVKVLYSGFLGQLPSKLSHVREVPWAMQVPMIVLALLCVVFGVYAVFPLERFINPVVHGAVGTSASGGIELGIGSFSPSIATGLILLGLAVGFLLFLAAKMSKMRTGRVFIGGTRPPTNLDSMHVSGTGFYNTIRETRGLSGLFANAEQRVFDVYEIGGRIGNGIVQGIRMLHNGVLSTYLSWAVIGLGVVVFALLSTLLRQLVNMQ